MGTAWLCLLCLLCRMDKGHDGPHTPTQVDFREASVQSLARRCVRPASALPCRGGVLLRMARGLSGLSCSCFCACFWSMGASRAPLGVKLMLPRQIGSLPA